LVVRRIERPDLFTDEKTGEIPQSIGCSSLFLGREMYD
jgi:hypothetical protein